MFGRTQSSQGKRGSTANKEQAAGKSQTNEIDDKMFFNLHIFWEIAQDSNVHVNNRTKDLALNSLIEVLSRATSYNNSIRDPFIQLTIENIQRGDTIFFSVGFFLKLLGTYPNDDSQMGSSHGSKSRYGGRS